VPSIVTLLRRRHAAVVSIAVLFALLALALAPHALGPVLGRAFAAFSAAHPVPLCLGCALFVASLLCSAGGWRAAVVRCDGRLGRSDAAAYYGLGSLASTLLPAGAGDAVRVALFSRALPSERRVWTAGGVLLALAAVRTAVLCGFVVAAAVLGAIPLWPLAALGGVVVAAAAVTVRARRTQAQSRAGHLLDAFRALGREPRAARVLATWAAGSIVCRFGATAAAAAALGVSSPLLAALVIVPAMELAALVPLTPGNVGVADGAVAVALHTTGAHGALAIAIAIHAVETLASILVGGWSLLHLIGARSPATRRLMSAVAGTAGVAAATAAALIIRT
jgi:uncharacterized membrane protein YbhN (UPF0104 family)